MLNSCAWENLPAGGEEVPTRIVRVMMRLGGPIRNDLFYYIVFNLSGDPTKKPYSIFDGEDRGKYWTVYYMYGQPPLRDLDLYRGFGGKTKDGDYRIDQRPTQRYDLNELMDGTTISGDQITLVINLTEFGFIPNNINMNMIVCNQAIDLESKFEYEWDPYVFDSFYERGITIDLNSIDPWWGESNYEDKMEVFPNENEETAPPGADIIDWYFTVISD
jgi:hypothetical protein